MKKLVLILSIFVSGMFSATKAQESSAGLAYSLQYQYGTIDDFTSLKLQMPQGSNFLTAYTYYFQRDANKLITSGSGSSPFTPETSSFTMTVNGNTRTYTSTISESGSSSLSRRETFYAHNGQDTAVTVEIYDEATSQFNLTQMVRFYWNANGKLIGDKNYNYNGTNWVMFSFSNITLDANELPLIDSSYSIVTGTPVATSIRNYTNTGGKLDYATSVELDFNNVYVNSGKAIFTNNAAGKVIEILEQEWNESSMTWESSFKIVLGYEGPTSLAENTNNDLLKIYPNPAQNHLFINTQAIDAENIVYEIYSTDGRLVKSDILNNSLQHIEIANISNGLYFVKVNANGKIYTQKFLKQ